MAPMNFEQARFNMVEQQIRPWDVLDQGVLDLLYAVPREEFVRPEYRALAFTDMEVPIGEGERMMAPKMEARILQELAVRKSDSVLEVGTGSGYLTALLAHRAAHVHSVEIKSGLAEFGRTNLARHGTENVTLETGDASRGQPARGPFDVIVLTGSSPVLPKGILAQLAPGGRLFGIFGDAPVMVAKMFTRSPTGDFRSVELFDTMAAPLVNAEQPSRFDF
jgi:protein-L-isoaspartate(D-aspartate) O-methyltransferase